MSRDPTDPTAYLNHVESYRLARGGLYVARLIEVHNCVCLVVWPTHVSIYPSLAIARKELVENARGPDERVDLIPDTRNMEVRRRGALDAAQDVFEGAHGASIGKTMHQLSQFQVPSYIAEDDANDYLLGYLGLAQDMGWLHNRPRISERP